MFKLGTVKPTIPVLTITALLMNGCATQTNDCSNAIASAQAAGRAGQTFDSTANINLPSQKECHAEAEQAWQSGLAQYCQPQNGFDIAYRGNAQPVLCEQDSFVNAYRHGQVLFELQTEQVELEQRIAELKDRADTISSDQQQELTRLRNRLITIQRDLPEWLTLAQLEGFLAPQAVPDQPAATERE